MAETLTRRQREILEFIKRRIRERGYPPSVREIGEAVGLASSSTVHGHLARLEDKGYLRRDPSKPRAIEVLDDAEPSEPIPSPRVVEVPVVGRVAAGSPILAEENVEDVFPLPEDWVRGGEVFMLEVRGDSMIDAGILDGDRVIVRKQDTAENGDIVVALIGDEATVKRYYREADHIRLQPENSRLQPIRTRDATIIGRVIGLVRLF
ncbi:MAG: transcriptional repressor LexA [Clostridia bacterium]|nr:transcriptional repressor LexA [Clostridia bacterium]